MKKYLYIGLIVLAVLAFAYWAYKKYYKNDKNKCYQKNSDGSLKKVECDPNKLYTASNGNLIEAAPGTQNASPLPSKSLNQYIGQWVKAKYSGTKLYDNNLNVVATYDAGDDIGRLGTTATGYSCCKNHNGFYRILETDHATGWCSCEPIMSDVNLKSIFGL